jgi:hypothetical protein
MGRTKGSDKKSSFAIRVASGDPIKQLSSGDEQAVKSGRVAIRTRKIAKIFFMRKAPFRDRRCLSIGL